MDMEHKVGTIMCDGCGAKFTSRISLLSDPIDVYSDWIDASEAVNEGGGAAAALSAAGGERGGEEEDPDY